MAEKPEDAGDLYKLVGEPESPYYDPETIADEAVWPLVDYLWHGNWREDAFPGQSFVFPKTGIDHEGRHLNVKLMASQESDEINANGDKGLFSDAALVIEEILPEPIRSHIVDGLVEDDSARFRGYDIDQLIVKQGSAYLFDVYGNVDIDLYQEIEGPGDGMPMWHVSEDKENDDEGIVAVGMEQEVKIRDHDLESMECAFKLLGSPEGLLDILSWVRQDEAIKP